MLNRPYLTDVANGYGATTHFDYTELPTTVPANQWSRQQVTGRTTTASNTETVTIEYPQPAAYLVTKVGGNWDYVHARFRGFPSVRETDAYRKVLHSYFTTYGDGISTLAINGQTDISAEKLSGREASQVTSDLSNVTLRTVQNTYAQVNFVPHTFVFLYEQTDQLGAAVKKVRFGSDAAKQGGQHYGNITDRWEWDVSNGTRWHRHTETIFYPRNDPRGAYLVGLPGTVTVYQNNGSDGDGDWIRRTHYVYDFVNDNLSPGFPGIPPASLGELRYVRQVLRADPNLANRLLTVDTAYQYDSYGNRTLERRFNALGSYQYSAGSYSNNLAANVRGRSTITTIDPTYRVFPISVTNALGQATQQTFDPGSGRILTRTDPNGRQTVFEYDVFKRLTRVLGPTVTPGGYRPTTTYEYGTPVTGSPTTTRLRIQRRRDAGTVPEQWETTYQYLDGRGRVTQTQREATVGGASGVTVQNAKFDSGGQPFQTGQPYFVSGGTGTAFLSSDWNTPGTRARIDRAFDALRRPTEEKRWDGVQYLPSRRWSYTDWTTATIDENGHKIERTNDALGRLVRVKEYAGTGTVPDPHTLYATTSYQYTEADQLKQTQDAAGNLGMVTYDKLGRKTSQTDPDLGTWSYVVNAQGELVRQTDARGQEVAQQFDDLGRVTARGPRGVRPITAAAITTLRQDVNTRRQATGLAPYAWTDPTLTAGMPVKAVHLTDLRQAILGLPGHATLPNFTRGAIVAGRPIYEQDLLDVEGWLYGYAQLWPEPKVNYQYDQGTNGIGRRTGMTDEAGTVSWTYDEVGQAKTESRTFTAIVPGGDNLGTYATTTTYDALGRPATFTYPGGEVLT